MYIAARMGQKMMKKGRFFIIVKKVETGKRKRDIHEIGVYTNGDTGLRNIDPKDWHKYFSLCPKHIDAANLRISVPKILFLKSTGCRKKRARKNFFAQQWW
jgi:hypothetical protein